jgi:general secretion pathway protein D
MIMGAPRTEVTYTPVPAGQPVTADARPGQESPIADRPTAPPGVVDDGIQLRDRSSLRITAVEITNSLLILATPREHEIVDAALKKLDVLPLQVLIEAAIAEVTLTNQLKYGIQYFLKTGNHAVGFSNSSTLAVTSQLPGFNYLFSAGANIQAILSLLDSVTDVRVVSSPEIMVLNNQTASLQVGDQVPIASQSAVSVLTPGAPVVNTIQYRDTGVVLKVTPRVNEGGLVLMDISQEVSDVAKTTTSGIDSPTIQQRKINSSVAIRTGETIALGGLIKDSTDRSRNGIPLLQDIPLIGPLFSTTSDDKTRTELIVLITPRVIRDPESARGATEELRRKVPLTLPLNQRIQ